MTNANLFIKILTQLLVQGRQVAAVWSGENSERDVHHLQVLGAGGAGDLPGAGPDVVDYRVLEPGNPEVKSFGQGVVLDPTEPVEHDCPVTTINSVHGILQADVGAHSYGDQFSSKAEALWCFSHSSRQVVQFVSHDNSEVDSEKKISHHYCVRRHNAPPQDQTHTHTHHYIEALYIRDYNEKYSEASQHHVGKVGETCWLGKMETQSISSAVAADDTGKRTVSGPAAQRSNSVPEETSLWCPGPNCNTSVNADGLKNTLKKFGS